MIEKFEDLELDKCEAVKQVEEAVKEKLGFTFEELAASLSNYLVSHAEEIALELPNIAPHGDYGKMLEDNDSMANFLKTEAHKVEHWFIQGITPSDVNKQLIAFHFGNQAVTEGEAIEGFVYVSLQGKVKHAFVQAQ